MAWALVLATSMVAACGGDDDDDTGVQPDAGGGVDASVGADAGGPDAAPVAVTCNTYCAAVTANCTGADEQFADEADCLAFCETNGALELGTNADSDVNTAGCRQANAEASAIASTTCMAAGPTGGDTCGTWCDNYCDFALLNCTGDNELYADMTACLTACGDMQPSGVPGQTVGDSVQCRIFHALAAADDPALGCANAAPDGGTACIDQGSGDICEDATEILGTPFSSSDTTVGLTDDSSADTCAGIGDGTGDSAPDGLFEFIAVEDGLVLFSVDPEDTFDVALYVADVCDDIATSCFGGADDAGEGGVEEVVIATTAGTTYFVVVDGFASGDEGAYTLTIDAIDPDPDLECTLGGTECTDAGTVDVGNAAFGFTNPIAGELSNIGLGTLDVTDISITAMTNVTAASVDPTTATVDMGSSEPFTLLVEPTAAGAFSLDVTITSNDTDVPSLSFTVTGTAIDGAPDIGIASGTIDLADGDTQNLGLLPIDPAAGGVEYEVFNDGNAPLTVTGVTLGDEVNITVMLDPATAFPFIVAPGDTGSFVVNVSAGATGDASFTIAVASDDPDENPFDLTVLGEGALTPGDGGDTCDAPTVVDGEPWAGLGNNADAEDDLFGGDCPGVDVTPSTGGLDEVYSFTPAADGTYRIDLATNGPLLVYVAEGACTDLTTTCIGYNDYFSDDLFFVDLTGGTEYFIIVDGFDGTETGDYLVSVFQEDPIADIAVSRGGADIADGGTDDLGELVAGETASFTYTIDNIAGTEDLIIDAVTFTNDVNAGAAVSTTLPLTVEGGSTGSLVVDVTPSAAGALSFDMDIESNAPGDLDPFSISVSGTARPPAPEIAVSRRDVNIADGDTEDLGFVATGTVQTVTYTIENGGEADLTITGVTVGNVTGVPAAVVSTPPAGTVTPGGATTFTITYSAPTPTAFSFEIDIDSDDADEDPFDIGVQGVAGDAVSSTSAPGAAIPDDDPAGVDDVISTADTCTVDGVNVDVAITHTFRGDIEITLTSPGGTTVQLKNSSFDGADDVVGNFPGDFVPAEDLGAFAGESSTGDWTLNVSDNFAADTGTFDTWGLNIVCQP